MISSTKWKWFVEAPLDATWRKRLEVTLGVVLSAALVVGASTKIQPTPEQIALHEGKKPLVSSPAPPPLPPWMVAEKPPVSSDFFNAVQAGDVARMNKHYRTGMPLGGMLYRAAQTGKKAPVEWLLNHEADVHEDEDSMSSALLVADDHPEIVKLLLDRGAKDGPLENAAWANAPNAVKRILAATPKIDEKGRSSVSAITHTTTGKAEDRRLVLKLLLDRGADPNLLGGLGRSSALAGATAACDGEFGADCLAMVDTLLDRGARLSADALGAALAIQDTAKRAVLVDKFLAMPLTTGMISDALVQAERVEPADLKRLSSKAGPKGVDWSYQDGEEDHALPLLAAVAHLNRDQVKAYLDAGAPVDTHYKTGSSALAEAIDASGMNEEATRIVELLVSRGANVNRRLPDGRTPLYAAAEAGSIRVVTFLLEKGARVNDHIIDDTALDAAERRGNDSAARLIHARGGRRGTPRPMYGGGTY